MIEKIKGDHVDYLFKAMMSLENTDEFYKFFDDICTVAEVAEMSKRLQAAKMLRAGTVYSEVSEKTGLSTATISRVSRCLKYGSDGYTLVLNRLDMLEKSENGDKTDEKR
ncbi:MAG: YerC/YecD family TrpR-related protein [Oscillospiraceae bacterium]|nr:YerC/YecD family TrpR-related protein [Oscillospiraceae bacterium]